MDEKKEPGIRIGQIFLLRSYFEHAENALELPPTTPIGEIPTSINVKAGVDETNKRGLVSLTVGSAEGATSLYRFHVEMCAVVEEASAPNMSLHDYVVRSGPPMLYPFAREVVASLTSKGRFGPIWLPPMNFVAIAEKMIAQQAEERAKRLEAEKEKTPTS